MYRDAYFCTLRRRQGDPRGAQAEGSQAAASTPLKRPSTELMPWASRRGSVVPTAVVANPIGTVDGSATEDDNPSEPEIAKTQPNLDDSATEDDDPSEPEIAKTQPNIDDSAKEDDDALSEPESEQQGPIPSASTSNPAPRHTRNFLQPGRGYPLKRKHEFDHGERTIAPTVSVSNITAFISQLNFLVVIVGVQCKWQLEEASL